MADGEDATTPTNAAGAGQSGSPKKQDDTAPKLKAGALAAATDKLNVPGDRRNFVLNVMNDLDRKVDQLV